MYTLLRSLASKGVFFEQLGVLVASLAIAEVFYKFHSFTLECVAFLATWFVLDLVVNRTHSLITSKTQQ